MSQDRFIFDTVDYQNGANTVNNFVKIYNAQNNSAVTGNSFKFKSDADRMKNLLGSKGQTRNSGYYDGLYATFYNLTFTDGTTVPSINGPGGAGWGAKLWSGPIPDLVNINDAYLTKTFRQSDYVAAQIGGYLYSPVATTVTFQVSSDDGSAIYFNGANVTLTGTGIAWDYHGTRTYTSSALTVNAGYNPFRLLFFEGGGEGILTMSYKLGTGPYQQLLPCNFFYNYNQM
jgi:hypothetical protein